ncbi:MAG: hypothetical protein FJX75_23290 [Armatimonadetes bacterium]|nr:hypothetical protein [Armatimonadota bacterium]
MTPRTLIVIAVAAACTMAGLLWLSRYSADLRAARVLHAALEDGVSAPVRTEGFTAVREASGWQEWRTETDQNGVGAKTVTRGPGRTVTLLDDGDRVWRLDAGGATSLQPSPRRVEWVLLGRNYRIRAAENDEIAGQPATGIALESKRTGRRAEVLWIEAGHSLILGRWTYDAHGHLVAQTEVDDVRSQGYAESRERLGAALARLPKAPTETPLTDAQFSERSGFAPLRPTHVPRGYREVGLYARTCPRGRVYAELVYFDGLRVMSIFERPGGRGGRGQGRGWRHGLGAQAETAEPVLVDEGQAKTVRVRRGNVRVFVTADLTQEEILRVVNSIP